MAGAMVAWAFMACETKGETNMANPELMPTFKTIAAQEAFLEAYDRELASWNVKIQGIEVETQYGRTQMIAFGDPAEKPLVLLHWFCSNSNVWKDMAPYLEKDFRVYAVDVMGDMGKSVATNPPKDEADLARWLEQVLDGLGLKKPFVGGLSNGGYTAAVFALLKPDRVERLILMAPAATLKPFSLSFYGLVYATAFNPSDKNIGKFKKTCTVHPERWSADFTSMLAMAFRTGKIQVKVFPRNFKDGELKRLSMPTLVLLGDKEFIYSAEKAADRARALVPGAEAIVLPGSNHAIPLDAPEAAAGAMIDFALRDA
jgi:pimeloyl-ACP methyl ester carboxylesterase